MTAAAQPGPGTKGVALIAGAGALPADLVAAADVPILVCAPEGIDPEGLAVDHRFRFERLAPFMRWLFDNGWKRVVFAGAIHRVKFDPLAFDFETASLVPRMFAAMKSGDDATLRAVIALCEDYGLTVDGVGDLAPGLLAGEGVLGRRKPGRDERRDAERARVILDALAPVDVAQGCVVVSQMCLAVEGLYGTDAMLDHVAQNRDARQPHKGGVLVKRAKRGQDLRVDLPTVGPQTITAMQAARLTGLSLQAGHVIVLDRARTLAAADAAGIAVWAEP